VEKQERLGRNFKQFIPNAYYKNTSVSPGWYNFLKQREVVAQTTLFVTTKPIKDGDELFCNYRFNPNLEELPDWYHHVDIDEDRERWE